MKIAVDIDEVLARGLATYLEYFNSTYDTSFTEEDFTPDKGFWEVLGVKDEDIAQVEQHYRTTMHARDWLLVPGAQEAILKLASQHELVIVSNRQTQGHEPTREWLQRNFGNSFGDVIFTEAERKDGVKPTKAEICSRIGAAVLIEDEVKEVNACQKLGIPVVLFETRLNQGVEGEQIWRVRSWPEALRAIEEVQAPA